MKPLHRIALAAAVVGYLSAALAPCRALAGPSMRADLSQPAAHAGHAGHAGAATRGTPPPCHGPQTLVKAPCACGCEERAAASSAQLDAGLKPAPPQVEWLALARRHDPPALLVGEVDLAGVDPVPRPA